MKLLLVCLLFFNSIICSAWEYELIDDVSVVATRPVVLPNGDILIAYTIASYVTGKKQSEEILKLSPEGEFKEKKDLTNYFPDLDFHATSITYHYNHVIYTGYGYDSTGMIKPFLIEMTENLDVTFDTIYNYQGAFKEVYPTSDSGYYISALSGVITNNYRCYWQLDKNFDIDSISVDSMKYAPNDFGWSTTDTKREFLYYFSASNCVLFQKNSRSLNSVNSHFCNDRLESFPFINNEGNVLMTGIEFDFWPIVNHLYVALFDSNLNIVDSLFFKNSELPNRAASEYSISQQDSFYYIGSTDNFSTSSSVMSATKKRAFMLVKTDRHLNLIWARRYRDDGSYVMKHVVATKDGGVLMIGDRWDWQKDSLKKEVSTYILKVNSSGFSTGIDNNLAEKQVEFDLFPNPTKGRIIIQTSSKGIFSVHNMLGYQVMNAENVEVGNTTIDLPSSLPRGIYILRFDSEEGTETKKIVLE